MATNICKYSEENVPSFYPNALKVLILMRQIRFGVFLFDSTVHWGEIGPRSMKDDTMHFSANKF